MALEALESRHRSLISRVGKAAAHTLFPKDFEYYLLAFELVNSKGITVDYFAFPILPHQIDERHNELTNVKKTMGGVTTIRTATFVPRDITLSGDFGKKFKITLGGRKIEFAGMSLSVQNGVFNATADPLGNLLDRVSQFSSFAKTGYGCIKVIEAMKEKSKGLDAFDKPYSLYMYNPILGNDYQVEVMSFSHSQDREQNNMVPKYNLSLKAIAPLSALTDWNSFSSVRNIAINAIQGRLNSVLNRARNI